MRYAIGIELESQVQAKPTLKHLAVIERDNDLSSPGVHALRYFFDLLCDWDEREKSGDDRNLY